MAVAVMVVVIVRRGRENPGADAVHDQPDHGDDERLVVGAELVGRDADGVGGVVVWLVFAFVINATVAFALVPKSISIPCAAVKSLVSQEATFVPNRPRSHSLASQT